MSRAEISVEWGTACPFIQFRNSFRMLNNSGILETYLEKPVQIGKDFRK